MKIFRSVRELKGFEKVFLKKGEEKKVRISLDRSAFEYYSVPLGRFDIEDGKYRIYAASSSRDLRAFRDITVTGNRNPEVMDWKIGDDFSSLFKGGRLPLIAQRGEISLNTSVSEILENPKARKMFKPLIDAYLTPFEGKTDGMSRMMLSMAMDMPLRAVAVMTGAIRQDELEKLIKSF